MSILFLFVVLPLKLIKENAVVLLEERFHKPGSVGMFQDHFHGDGDLSSRAIGKEKDALLTQQ